ncbi:hypothetical protein AU374_04181 [Cupriavidus metallidurans]|nr:hypothetical protein AU374_04181 [Cupriavidus metallidurans]
MCWLIFFGDCIPYSNTAGAQLYGFGQPQYNGSPQSHPRDGVRIGLRRSSPSPQQVTRIAMSIGCIP